MGDFEATTGDPSDKLAHSASRTVAAAALVALLVASMYFYQFHGLLATNSGTWGEFGDFVGGVINPVVGLATVYLVFVSISLQRRELQASVTELRRSNQSAARQSFEQSFFSWLQAYRELLNDIRDGTEVGRDVLESWYQQNFAMQAMHVHFEGAKTKGDGTRALFRLCGEVDRGADPTKLHEFFDEVFSAYTQLYRNKRSDLDALYRTLYRMILWIDGSDFDLKTRWHYVAIVRAQLSWIEGVYLLFNGLTHEGKKFGPVANKYALFDNLAVGSNAIVHMVVHTLRCSQPLGHDGKNNSPPWPYTDAAFDSDSARENAAEVVPPLVLKAD